MAVTDAYATVAQYRQTAQRTDTADDMAIMDDLQAVSRYLDRALNRFFTKDAALVVRPFIVPGDVTGALVSRLLVADIASDENLAIKVDSDGDGDLDDETAFTATDYQLLPLDAPLGPEPRPFTEIRLPVWSSQTLRVGQLVEIEAIWGWPAVPPPIKRATIEFTRMLRVETPYATDRINELDNLVQTSPQARGLLRGLVQVYNRYPVAVA